MGREEGRKRGKGCRKEREKEGRTGCMEGEGRNIYRKEREKEGRNGCRGSGRKMEKGT